MASPDLRVIRRVETTPTPDGLGIARRALLAPCKHWIELQDLEAPSRERARVGMSLTCPTCAALRGEAVVLRFECEGFDGAVLDMLPCFPGLGLMKDAAGRWFAQFPPPFADVRVTDGDRLDREASLRLRAAVAAFGGRVGRIQ